MHERGIAQDLVRAAGVTALEEGAERVRALEVRIGSLSHIDPEALRGQVEWWSHGTIVEGAIVRVEKSKNDARERNSTGVTLTSVEVDA